MKVRIEGLRALETALSKLDAQIAKNTTKRALKKAAQPLLQEIKQNAPVQKGILRKNLAIGTKLTRRQQRLAGKKNKRTVEIYVGATGLPHAHLVEFGHDVTFGGKTYYIPPNPFARPAWDKLKMQTLETIKETLSSEIIKSAKRAAKRAAKRKK